MINKKLLTKRTKQKESYAQHHLLLTPASGVCFCFVKPTIGMFHCLSQDWALLSQWWHVSSFSSFLFAVFDGCQFPEEKGTTRNWNRDDCFGEDHPAIIWLYAREPRKPRSSHSATQPLLRVAEWLSGWPRFLLYYSSFNSTFLFIIRLFLSYHYFYTTFLSFWFCSSYCTTLLSFCSSY